MYKIVTEGAAKIKAFFGDITKKDEVFYNPKMKMNRDISVIALNVFQETRERDIVVGDMLAATGIRGIRYALECKNIKSVIFNDLNPNAIKVIEENIALNGIKNTTVLSLDVCEALSKYKFLIDYVDIDPFGSPIQFLDSAARAVSNKGLLGITATDTAPLSGTYPRAALRKYGAVALREDIKHEVGIRILIANIARECAKYDKGYTPVLSYFHEHYFRVFGTIKKTRSAAELNIKNIGYVAYCKKCGFRELTKEKITLCACGSDLINAGPLWIGPIFDADFCKRALDMAQSDESKKLLSLVFSESSSNCLFYDVHYLSKIKKKPAPKMDILLEKLTKKGYFVSKTHFTPTGIRTNAPLDVLMGLF
ncbi:tRNA (guanine(10)-N(2))-dimethyltransferase [archaeon]|nr:tRNA (guanine(10)-N(2))-dimethyltransferase [archaeon]